MWTMNRVPNLLRHNRRHHITKKGADERLRIVMKRIVEDAIADVETITGGLAHNCEFYSRVNHLEFVKVTLAECRIIHLKLTLTTTLVGKNILISKLCAEFDIIL